VLALLLGIGVRIGTRIASHRACRSARILRPARPGCRLSSGRPAGRFTAALSEKQLELQVSDEGPGFPVAFLPHAFERFSRAEERRSRGGAGLGLAIVEAVARAHGGKATVENRPQGGASVRLSLPLATHAQSAIYTNNCLRAASGAGHNYRIGCRRLSIFRGRLTNSDLRRRSNAVFAVEGNNCRVYSARGSI
jgi:hypothetical protein